MEVVRIAIPRALKEHGVDVSSSRETVVLKLATLANIRKGLLAALILLGAAHPISPVIDLRGDTLIALNASPHHTVFGTNQFFSEVFVSLEYDSGSETYTTVELLKQSNMYSGKLFYSLFYMNYIFKTSERLDRVLEWYFCSYQTYSTAIEYQGNLKSVGIKYVQRRTGEIFGVRKVSCKNG